MPLHVQRSVHTSKPPRLQIHRIFPPQMNKFLGLLPSRVSFTCVTSARFEMPLAIYFRLLRITRSAMGANFWWIMKQNLSCFDLKEKSRRHEGKGKINISLSSAEIIREFALNSWARRFISSARCELRVPLLDEEEKNYKHFCRLAGKFGRDVSSTWASQLRLLPWMSK